MPFSEIRTSSDDPGWRSAPDRTSLASAINLAQSTLLNGADAEPVFNLLLRDILRLAGCSSGFIVDCIIGLNDETRCSVIASIGNLSPDELEQFMPVSPASRALEVSSNIMTFSIQVGDDGRGVIRLMGEPERLEEFAATLADNDLEALGNCLRIARFSRDSSAREANLNISTQLHRSLMDVAVDCIIAADQDGRIIEFNPAAEAAFGWSRHEVLGKLLTDTLIPRGPDQEYSSRLARYHDGIENRPGVYRCRTLGQKRDGTHFPVDLAVANTLIDGEVRFACYARDISEDVRAEENLKKALIQAEGASHAKSAFVAMVSHEIRTPLNAIRGSISLLRDLDIPDEARHMLRVANDSSELLVALVNDILDFSKIEAGKMLPKPVETGPAKVLDEVLQLMSIRGYRNRVNICGFVGRDVPDDVILDEGRLRQILVNLVGNAVKHAPGGTTTVRVGVGPGRILKFEVVDDGDGIPESERATLFTEFSRGHDSSDEKAGSTGLGLAICKRLAELLGGEIGYSSRPGEGSTFWFTMPYEDSGVSKAQRGSDSPLIGMRLLIAGSDSRWRRVLSQQLTEFGIEVVGVPLDAAAVELGGTDGSSEHYDGVIISGIYRANPYFDQIVDLAQNSGVKLIALVPMSGLLETNNRVTKSADFVLGIPVLQSELVRCLNALANSSQFSETAASSAREEIPDLEFAVNSKLRILLVEDGQANRLVGTAMLRKHGFNVDAVADGYEAVEAVGSLPYDLVLMDLSMPDMDGFEATRRIRGLDGSVAKMPIIAVTATVADETIQRCMDIGMNGYIPKPIDKAELLKCISQVTGEGVVAKQ